MIRLLLVAIFVILGLTSCMSPYVQTDYAISGMGSDPLIGMQGSIEWADGERVSTTGQELGLAKSRLLTFIFLTPGAGGNGTEDGGCNTGGQVATFRLSNGISPKRVDAKAEWDKRADVVSIDGVKYKRSLGALFVIVKSPGSTAKVWQLNPPSGIKDDKKLLEFAKKSLPSVSAVKSASFH